MFPQYLWGAEWAKYRSPVLRTMTVIGYMQSGKTVFVRFIAKLMHDTLVKQGVDDSQIAYIETPSLQAAKDALETGELGIDAEKLNYMFVFVDDAIRSAHSRRNNIVETMLFSYARHWTLKRGVLIIAYATQDFRLLDRLMRNAHVYAWKSLPFEWFVSTDSKSREIIVKWIGDVDVLEYLEAMTRAIYSNKAEKSLAALSQAVVRIPILGWGPRIVRGIKPEAPPDRIYYVIDEDERKEDTDIDAETWRRALCRLVHVLVNERWRFHRNREVYTLARSPSGKSYSLGPTYEIISQCMKDKEQVEQVIFSS